MRKSYNIDVNKPLKPEDVREALVSCFTQAHEKELEELRTYSEVKMSKEEFEKIKNLNVRQLIQGYFKEVGGEYKSPTKESLLRVMDKLAKFAVNFRDKETVKNNYNKVLKLVNSL